MAKETNTSAATGGGGQRPPLTIDLSAEEVRKRAAAEAQPQASATEPAARKPADVNPAGERASAKPEEKPVGPTASTAADPIPSALASEARQARAHPDAPRGRSLGAFLAAALAGGVVGAIVVLLAGRFLAPMGQSAAHDLTPELAALRSEVEGLRQQPASPAADLDPLNAQIAALQQAVDEISNQAPAETQSGAALKDLQERLTQLESTAGQAPSAEPDTALLAQVQELGGSIGPLQAQVTDLGASVDMLRQQVESLDGKIGEASARADTAMAIAPAVAAGALTEALQSGGPFTTELNALRSLGLDEAKLAALEPRAQSGLPTLAKLIADFEAAAGRIDLRPPVSEDTGAIDRLLASARGLVEVRQTRPVTGDEPAAVIARIRVALAAGDLATALADWAKLPDAAKAETAEWQSQVEARHAADALAAQLRQQALSRLQGQG